MTPKQAYCCLNCTASANCCGACGECPGCCADCEDLSRCINYAYFDGSSFYTDFRQSVSITNTARWKCEGCIGPMDYNPEGNTYSNSSYTIDTELGLTNCDSFVSEYMILGPGNPYELTEASNLNTCSRTLSAEDFSPQTASGPCPAVSPQGDVQCACCSGNVMLAVNGCSNPLRPLVDAKGQTDCGEDCMSGGGETSSSISVTISFRNPVKLYNSKGQVVDPIVIGATYNPCNATAQWNAPGCHFFAP